MHDFVPFYFAPRSPMLFAINGGRVAGCPWRQGDIIHFETTVQNVAGLGNPMSTTTGTPRWPSAGPTPTSRTSTRPSAWDLLTEAPQLDGFCMYWQSRAAVARYVDRMERRQAEFLVKDRAPLHCMTRLGVIDAARQSQVQALLTRRA